MNEQELQALIADNEGDRVELTTSTRDTDKFATAVCAFIQPLHISEKFQPALDKVPLVF